MITVLTDSVYDTHDDSSGFLKSWGKRFQGLVRSCWARRSYGGHAGVTRSLVEGLASLGARYRYNPTVVSEVGEVVVVLAGITPLLQAIGWKRSGRIGTLLAGPNIVVRPIEFDGVIAAPEVDVCIVPSGWVRRAYVEDVPALEERIRIWAAGVNQHYWNGARQTTGTRMVLLYIKGAPEALWQRTEELLRLQGWNPTRVLYGQYEKLEYRHKLKTSAFAVFLSRSESQGLALAEAWAMGVPTLVWNPGELTFEGRRYTEVSSCPYLTNKTGVSWTTLEEFEAILSQIEYNLPYFAPRRWVLSHITDERAAQNFLSIVSEITSTRVPSCHLMSSQLT